MSEACDDDADVASCLKPLTSGYCGVEANAEMWVVTQVGRIGAVVRASKVASSDGPPIVVCRALFGKRDDATHDLFARVLAERVIAATGAPLTLAFALKPDVDAMQLKAIVELCCTLL